MKLPIAIALLCVLSSIATSTFGKGLPTSEKNWKLAIKSAPAVYVGHFTKLGESGLGPPGTATYNDALFSVQEVLVGSAAQNLQCSFDVRLVPLDDQEAVPVVGETYLVIGAMQDPEFLEARQIVEASPENLELAHKLLGKPLPAPKGSPSGPTPKASPDELKLNQVTSTPSGASRDGSPTMKTTTESPTEEKAFRFRPAFYFVVAVLLFVAGWFVFKRMKRRRDS